MCFHQDLKKKKFLNFFFVVVFLNQSHHKVLGFLELFLLPQYIDLDSSRGYLSSSNKRLFSRQKIKFPPQIHTKHECFAALVDPEQLLYLLNLEVRLSFYGDPLSCWIISISLSWFCILKGSFHQHLLTGVGVWKKSSLLAPVGWHSSRVFAWISSDWI